MEDILELTGGSLTGAENLAEFEAWDSLAVLSFVMYAERVGHKPSGAVVRGAQTVDDLYVLIPE